MARYGLKTISEALAAYRRDLIILVFGPEPLTPQSTWEQRQQSADALRKRMTDWLDLNLPTMPYEPIAPDGWLMGDSFMLALRPSQVEFDKLYQAWEHATHKPRLIHAEYRPREHRRARRVNKAVDV